MLSIQAFTFNPFQENTYVVYDENQSCMIIDPGMSDAQEQATLLQFIETHQLKPVFLVNTHCHIDHILGNQFVADTWKLTLHLHAGELPVLKAGPQIAQMYGFSYTPFVGEMAFLNPGDKITLGKDVLDILFTPGHSPASISLYDKITGVLISGDVLFQGSIGRTDLPGGNFDTLEASIRSQLYTLPDATRVFSGHGPATTIGHEKRNNPFVQAP